MTEREQLTRALTVLRRGRSGGSLADASYAVYLVALFGAVYGFPYGRTAVDAMGRSGIVDAWADGGTRTLAGLALAGCLVATVVAGRVRGPVIPPAVWTRLVLSGPSDRYLALRRWWRLAAYAVIASAGVVGLLTGLSLWSGGATGARGALLGGAAGVALGGLLAWVWLLGQASVAPARGARRRPLRVRELLRHLDTELLLAHAARATAITGGALTGDTRAVRDEVRTVSPRLGAARLRPGRASLVRADLLAVRRQPARLALPVLLTGLAGVLPVLVPGLVASVGSSVCLYLACSRLLFRVRDLAERGGERLAVTGWGTRHELTAHLALPVAVTTGVLTGVLAGVGGWSAVVHGAVSSGPLLVPLASLPLALGVALWAAGRELGPILAFTPQTLVLTVAARLVGPVLAVAGLTLALVGLAPDLGAGSLRLLVVGLALTPLVLAVLVRRLR